MFRKYILLLWFLFMSKICFGGSEKTPGQKWLEKSFATYDAKLGIVDTEKALMVYDKNATVNLGITDVYRGHKEIKQILDIYYYKHARAVFVSESSFSQDRAVNDDEWVTVLTATVQFIPKSDTQCPVSMKVFNEAHLNRHTGLITHSYCNNEFSEEEFVTRMNTCQKMLSKQQVLDFFNNNLRQITNFDTPERMKKVYERIFAKDAVLELVTEISVKLVGREQILSIIPAIDFATWLFDFQVKSYVIVGNKLLGEFINVSVPRKKLECTSFAPSFFGEVEFNINGEITQAKQIFNNEEFSAFLKCVNGNKSSKLEL